MKILINKSNGDILIKSTHKYVKRVGSRGNYKYFYRVNGKIVEGSASGPGTKENRNKKAGVKKEKKTIKYRDELFEPRTSKDIQEKKYRRQSKKEIEKIDKEEYNPAAEGEQAAKEENENRKLSKEEQASTFEEASNNIVEHIQETFENGDLSKRSIESGSAAKKIVKEYINNFGDSLHSDKEIEYLKQVKEKMIKDVQNQLNNMDWERE